MREQSLRCAALGLGAAFGVLGLGAVSAHAATCAIDHPTLLKALKASVKPSGGPANGGFENNEWAVVVARDATVCTVAFSGTVQGDQWPASRAIAAEKASTANGVSLSKYALSTANLYAASQPGGYLYGTGVTDVPDPSVLYAGSVTTWGTAADPMTHKRPGGVVDYGGGLALYDGSTVVGALGVSGDTPCADANVAWRVRHALGLDKVPNGPSPKHNDAVIYDIGPNGKSASGFGHPMCGRGAAKIAQQIGAGYIGQKAMAQSAAGQAPATAKAPTAANASASPQPNAAPETTTTK